MFQRSCLLHSVMLENFFQKIPSQDYYLDESTNLLNVIFLKSPMMVQKVITTFDSSETSGPNCLPVVVLMFYESAHSYILADLFKIFLGESCFYNVGRTYLCFLCSRILRKSLWLKTTVMQVSLISKEIFQEACK